MINRDNNPWRPLPAPDIDWRDGIPVSKEFDDVYYSTDDGIAESHYVFLEGSQFRSHLKEKRLTIAETGFGTGLNCLVALNAWLDQSNRRASDSTLHYIKQRTPKENKEKIVICSREWVEKLRALDK